MRKIFSTLLLLVAFACTDEGERNATVDQFEEDIIIIERYLDENGLTATADAASGIRFKIEEIGGGLQPFFADSLRLSYTGTILESGVEFAKVENEILEIDEILEGIIIAVTKIREGGKVIAYLPSFYGFGTEGNDIVPPNTVLRVELEFHELYNSRMFNEFNEIDAYLDEQGIDADIHPSGIRFTSTSGSGRRPTSSSVVTVNYAGKFLNGSEFESGNNISISLPGMVLGWQVMLPEIREGGTVTFYLPSQFGYGPQGRGLEIPSNTIIFYEVDLINTN